MRKLFYLVVILGFFGLWREGKLPDFSENEGAYDENGNPMVLIFTVQNCGKPCLDSLQILKKRRVPFKHLVVNEQNRQDEEFRLWKKFGRNLFPFIIAGNSTVMSSSQAQLVGLLGENFGTKYLTHMEKKYFKQHFYADGSPRIVMYGADWCPYCAKLRKEFHAEKVDYLEIDVEKSGEKKMMSQVMQIAGYPATWVGYTRVNGTTLDAITKVMNK